VEQGTTEIQHFFVGDQGSLPVIMAGRPVPAATLIVEGEAVALRDRMKR